MKYSKSLNIILYFVLLLYCCTLQYNIPCSEPFSKKNDSGEKYFIELHVRNIALVDNKTNLRTFHSENNFNKLSHLFCQGIQLLKIKLFNLQYSKIDSFFDLIKNKDLVFKDFRICFPFHFFY